jgi:hypothetical protein
MLFPQFIERQVASGQKAAYMKMKTKYPTECVIWVNDDVGAKSRIKMKNHKKHPDGPFLF